MNKLLIFFLLIPFSFTQPIHALQQNSQYSHIKTYKFNFSKNEFFAVSYADYPAGEEQFFELQSMQHAALPAEINTSQSSLKISGNNHSDDLFMYAYKKLSHLKPNTRYQVSFSLEFASNAPKDSIGAGGSPGDSVYMKIGVVSQKPSRYIDESGYYRMSLDKGNQGSDGKDMILIGDISVDNRGTVYLLKSLPYQPNEDMLDKMSHYEFTSTNKGEGWLIFGTDSGYESKTTLFYTSVVVTFKEIHEQEKHQ